MVLVGVKVLSGCSILARAGGRGSSRRVSGGGCAPGGVGAACFRRRLGSRRRFASAAGTL